MQITVKTLDGQARPFTLEEDLTVRQLKELIAREMDIPLERQRLIFQGRVLVDEKQLSEYRVDGKTLHLVQRLPNSEMPPTSATANEPQVPPGLPPPNMSIEELRTVVQQVLDGLGEVTRGSNITLRDTGHGVEVHVELPSHAVGQTGAHRVSIARIRKAFLERAFTQIETLIAFLERLTESDADEHAQIPMMPPADSEALNDQSALAQATRAAQPSGNEAQPSAEAAPAAQEASASEAANASRPLPISELAALYERLAALQVRSATQMRIWTELLRTDPSFQSSTPGDASNASNAPNTARRRAQVRHDVTGRLMHLIAHVTHNLSDFIVEFNETPPRNLLVLTDTPVQTAVLVQPAGVAMPGLPFPNVMPQGPQMHVSPFAFPLGTPPQPQQTGTAAAATRPAMQPGTGRPLLPGAPFMPPGFPLSVGQFGVPVPRMAGPGVPQFGIGLPTFAARNGVDASGARFTALSTPPRTFYARGPGQSMTLNNVSAHVVAAYRDEAGGPPNATGADAAQAGYTDMLRQVLDQTIRQSLNATVGPLGPAPGSPPNPTPTPASVPAGPRAAVPIRAPIRPPQPRVPIIPNHALVWPPMMPNGFENQHTLDNYLPCTSRHWSLVEPNASRDSASSSETHGHSPLSITININTSMPGVLIGNQPRTGASPQAAASRTNRQDASTATSTNTSTAPQASTTNTPPRPSLPTGAGPFPLPFAFGQPAFGVGLPFVPPQGAAGAPFVMMPPFGAFLGGQPQGANQQSQENFASMMLASAMPFFGSMLNALLGGGGGAQPNLSLYDVLQGAMTQAGESLPDDVLSDLLRAVLRVLTITDVPTISMGNNEPIDRLRAPLRAYLVRSLFVNASDADAARREGGTSSTVDDAHVDRVLASVTTAQIDDAAALFARQLVPLIVSLLDSDEEDTNSQYNTTLWLNTFRSRHVDVDRTLERLTRREAARLIRVIIDTDRASFATRIRDTLDQSITALISVLDAIIEGGLNTLENSLRNRAAQLVAPAPGHPNPNALRPSNFLSRFPGAADYLIDSIFRQFIATRRNRLLAADELAEYIVTEVDNDQGAERTTERRRLTAAASANTNSDEQMATDADREQFDTPPESMVTDSDETPSTTAKPPAQTNASVPEPLESAALDARLLEEATANVSATVGESIVAVFGLTVEADDDLEQAAANTSLPQSDSASWQRAVPASWLPTMLRDADSLTQASSSESSAGPSAPGDLSDAYLGGLPSKRRKTLNLEKAQHAHYLRVGDANSSARSLRSLVEQAADQLHVAPLAAQSNANAAANPYAVLEHELHETATGGQQLTTQFAGEIERQFATRARSFAEMDRAKPQYANVAKLLDKTAQQRSDEDGKK